MESFRDQRDGDSEARDEFVNSVLVDRYIKNNLSDDNNNVNIYVNDKEQDMKISRRTTSLQKSFLGSFLMKNKKSSQVTSFSEFNNVLYKKEVSTIRIWTGVQVPLPFDHNLQSSKILLGWSEV